MLVYYKIQFRAMSYIRDLLEIPSTPMPGTNLALDESYEIKSTSSKPLHGSLSLAGQTEQQNAMSYFTCLPDDGDHLIREDRYLPLGNVGAQDSLAEREPMRKLSTTLPTETSAYKRSVQSLVDPKSGHVNYVTGRWCSDDPFAPTPNSPTLSISSLKFDEPVIERRPQPLSKPSSLFKTTDLLPIPSSFPTMNSENSNRPRTGDSIQVSNETSQKLVTKIRDTVSSSSVSSGRDRVSWARHSGLYDGSGYDFGFNLPPTYRNLLEGHSNEQEKLEEDTF